MTLDAEKIPSLLPHGPGMQLLDQVIRCNADELIATTTRHRALNNPLRRSCGMLPISSGLEFAGQASALHGALLEGGQDADPRQGFLVMARDVTWRITRLDDLTTDLEIRVQLLSRNDQSAMYQFHLSTPIQSQLMAGRMAVFFPAGSP